jgi:hypothetical protein
VDEEGIVQASNALANPRGSCNKRQNYAFEDGFSCREMGNRLMPGMFRQDDRCHLERQGPMAYGAAQQGCLPFSPDRLAGSLISRILVPQ